MSNQDALFFRKAHSAFLTTHDPAVLDRHVMYSNLYRQVTGAKIRRYGERISFMLRELMIGLIFGVPSLLILAIFLLTVIQDIANDGIGSHGWIKLGFGLIVLIPASLGAWLGITTFKRLMIELTWNERRLESLLQQMVRNGKLIEGHIVAGKTNQQLVIQITYRFISPTSAELKRVFYPDHYQKYEPGTPVWVLYLNDKISVLL